ncbi:MAG: CGNR zinc finger domain-containing protein [Acidimicrobiia bacterium]
MDFSHYDDDAVQMAVDLINTVDNVAGTDALQDIDGLRSFLEGYEHQWSTDDFLATSLTDSHVRRVKRLRTRLRQVFEAETAEEAAETINAILADVSATPRVSLHSAHPHLHFEPLQAGPVRWLGAAAAMGLATVLVDQGIDRFGTCSAHDCVDAYVDTSRNRSRKHCSTTCSNRSNVAAHRRRAATS